MTRLSLVGILCGVFCLMGAAGYAEDGDFYGEIGPACAFALNTDDDLGSCFGADAKVGYYFLDWVGLDLNLSYLTGFEETSTKFDASEELDIMTALLNVRLAPDIGLDKVRLYAYAGAGGIFNSWDRSWAGGQESETVVNPALQVGCGADFFLTDFLYLAPELKYLNDLDEISYVSIMGLIGIRL